MLRIISRVRAVDKWMEFWFEDGNQHPQHFDNCCKSYMLWDLVDEDLAEAIVNTGFVGRALDWPAGSDRPLRFVPAIGIRCEYLADLAAPNHANR